MFEVPRPLLLQTALTVGVLGTTFCGYVNAQEFSYNGDTGPGFWSELSPDWEACSGTGSDARQSPINIGKVRVDKSLRKLDVELYSTTIDVFNNGHTIEQEYDNTGSWIRFEGQDYDLKQFHFHTLSEHTVGRAHSLMELHAVFQNDTGYLVIGQLFEPGSSRNPFIQKLIDAGLPEKDGDSIEVEEEINLADVLTSTKHYFTYPGSLTTPACTETVTWVVLAKPARVSADQYEAFRSILGNNFRPLQALNDRVVRGSVNLSRHGGKKSKN